MHASNNLTIRELPKTKKTVADEQHPMFKLQKNVRKILVRNFLSRRKSVWDKSE